MEGITSAGEVGGWRVKSGVMWCDVVWCDMVWCGGVWARYGMGVEWVWYKCGVWCVVCWCDVV